MNISELEQNIISSDNSRQQTDSASVIRLQSDSGLNLQAGQIKKLKIVLPKQPPSLTSDTLSVCFRNPISDITFYDSTNFILKPPSETLSTFPFLFLKEKTRIENIARVRYYQSLKPGDTLNQKPLHDDWIIIVILFAAFLYALIKEGLTKNLSSLSKFFLFRGIGDPSSRDTGSLFHLNSTILNLVSFVNISLFIYCISYSLEIIPSGISGFLFWLLSLGVVISALTLRHITCYITGRASSQTELFNEYIITIYQSYRYSAFVLLMLIVIICYVSLFPVKALLYTGILVFILLYLFRLTRLVLIFIKRNVSILYLILYLCALEFLPVVVFIKFLTGLF